MTVVLKFHKCDPIFIPSFPKSSARQTNRPKIDPEILKQFDPLFETKPKNPTDDDVQLIFNLAQVQLNLNQLLLQVDEDQSGPNLNILPDLIPQINNSSKIQNDITKTESNHDEIALIFNLAKAQENLLQLISSIEEEEENLENKIQLLKQEVLKSQEESEIIFGLLQSQSNLNGRLVSLTLDSLDKILNISSKHFITKQPIVDYVLK